MTGSFSGLGTALSALRYNRVAMDVAGGNIANVNTEGYTRRRVNAESVAGPDVPALWSRYDGHGDGVRVSGVDRMTDELLRVRSRREHAAQSYLDVTQASLQRVEDGVGEPGDTGVSAALNTLRSAWHDLVNSPDSSAARSQVLAGAATVVDAIRAQAHNVQAELGDRQSALVDITATVNATARELAGTNAAIAAGTTSGDDVNTLLDKRDQLTSKLAQLSGATATVRADGGADVSLGGLSLVAGNEAGSLQVGTGPTFTLTAPDGTSGSVATALGGQLGGTRDLVTTTLPAYLTSLAGVAKSFADGQNAQHQAGYDAAGNPGTALFDYDPADVLGTLSVAITDPAEVAASSVPGGGRDAGNADALATGPGVEDAYQRIVTGLGAQVAEVNRRADTQQALTTQVDNATEQLGGVDLDEEMVHMMSAQRAYEAASRLMTTLDSVLDTLINRTGLTH